MRLIAIICWVQWLIAISKNNHLTALADFLFLLSRSLSCQAGCCKETESSYRQQSVSPKSSLLHLYSCSGGPGYNLNPSLWGRERTVSSFHSAGCNVLWIQTEIAHQKPWGIWLNPDWMYTLKIHYSTGICLMLHFNKIISLFGRILELCIFCASVFRLNHPPLYIIKALQWQCSIAFHFWPCPLVISAL